MNNSFGQLYRITTFGESHGPAVGVVIDGFPAGFKLDLRHIQNFLNRRKPGQSKITTSRQESDKLVCLSGLENNMTLGSPLAFLVQNQDFKKQDYQKLKTTFRPSHADYTYFKKYGIKSSSGGGRSSARETIGRVIAAACAEQYLTKKIKNFRCVAFVDSVKDIAGSFVAWEKITRKMVDQNTIRCPDKIAAKRMTALIEQAKNQGDTVGGTIFCSLQNLPVGLGEPVFDKFEALLAQAMLSLPATKGFEIGSGFSGTKLFGSEHNDSFYQDKSHKIKTKTNFSGGIQGGISNGEHIYFRVAFKPVSTIFKSQETVDQDGRKISLKINSGRHDPCVLPRAVPMVEAMAILVAMDLYLRFKKSLKDLPDIYQKQIEFKNY